MPIVVNLVSFIIVPTLIKLLILYINIIFSVVGIAALAVGIRQLVITQIRQYIRIFWI